MSLLQVEALKAGYGKKTIIQDVSMHLQTGQLACLLGPNGCGKSTLIKALCKGISYQGSVKVCDQDIKDMTEKELSKLCTYVPQSSGLLIDISALEVVLMGFYPYLDLLQRPDKQMRELAQDMLERVGLKNKMHSNYMELSEGQKRMCILARSLVSDAKLLLMDEPDASLDFGVRNQLLQIIQKRVQNDKAGAMIALHDTDLALAYCQSIYLMQNGYIVGEIHPQEDSIAVMQQKLSSLYGNIKLLAYENENGERRITMVRE